MGLYTFHITGSKQGATEAAVETVGDSTFWRNAVKARPGVVAGPTPAPRSRLGARTKSGSTSDPAGRYPRPIARAEWRCCVAHGRKHAGDRTRDAAHASRGYGSGDSGVVSGYRGHHEFIAPGEMGWLFPTGNVDTVAERLTNLLGFPTLDDALRANGRAYVEQQRSWLFSIARYRCVYSELIGDHGDSGVSHV